MGYTTLNSAFVYIFMRHIHFGLTEIFEMVTLTSIKRKKEISRTVSFDRKTDSSNTTRSNGVVELVLEESVSYKKRKAGQLKLDTSTLLHKVEGCGSPQTPRELDEAAIKLQKFYKSYQTRRNLADCAVVVEELWWKALDFAALRRSSVSFFESVKSETAVSRWARAKTRAAKVGKGLSKDEKAQKLALRHWLEAIDPRHRYGHNLHLYYDVWFNSASSQPFFYWLDVGDGKEENLEKCPRTVLQRQCIKYLGPNERETYEVIVTSGKLVYRQSGNLVTTTEGSKWIFVLSASRIIYVAEKKKGYFQHSSFLSGGATIAAGRLVASDGVLEAVWCYSGHYRPTEEHFLEFISFLEEQQVDLTNVKKYPIDDDIPPSSTNKDMNTLEDIPSANIDPSTNENEHAIGTSIESDHNQDIVEEPQFDLGRGLPCKWTTGAGPRIGCVRDYPAQLQFQALEQVNLSPRIKVERPAINNTPVPSPRPSPNFHLSPRLAYMGLPSPRRLNNLSPANSPLDLSATKPHCS
ncbi:hypothetical protein ACLB2K_055227 [Fragaria x ananassa]